MSSRSRTYLAARSTQRPLEGHLHEMATTRPLPAPPQQRWHSPHLAGQALIEGPQVFVLGRPGCGPRFAQPRYGKSALARTLYLKAWWRAQRPVVVLDEAAVFTPVNLPLVAGGVIGPLAWAPRRSTSSIHTAGEW